MPCFAVLVLFCGVLFVFQRGMPGMAALQQRHITWNMPTNK